MKRFFKIVFPTIVVMTIMFVTIVVMVLFASNKATKIARAEFVRDSIVRAEFVKDSIATAKRNDEVIARCSNLFNVKKDEFSNITWVKPKEAPKYRNKNAVYCYFATEDGKATHIFRFVYQYSAEDWLFIRFMIFNIDGENITIIPDMETDCGYGGIIWEWCDEPVNNNTSGIDEDFIKKIANAKSVKVKMVGNQYSDIRTLSAAQIKSIKNTYEYYLALGGKFFN